MNPVNLFSHNSYTFAPANVDVFTGGRITQVASIFVNENEVKKLVAEQLRIGGVTKMQLQPSHLLIILSATT